MRKRILLGVFLTGILLIGIGTGIAFGEYSSFSYGGDVVLGQGGKEVETMEYHISLSGKKTRVYDYVSEKSENGRLVEDKTLKDGQVKVEVIYNAEYAKPYIEHLPYSADQTDETYAGEINISTARTISEFDLFMKYKDDILNKLKNKTISNYYYRPVESVTIKANANTMAYLEY